MPHCADCNSWLSDRYAERGNPPQNADGDVICAVCAGVYDDDDDDRPVAKPDGGLEEVLRRETITEAPDGGLQIGTRGESDV